MSSWYLLTVSVLWLCPRSAMGWSVVCDCGISWPYSLAFLRESGSELLYIGNVFPLGISQYLLYMCSEPLVMNLDIRTLGFTSTGWPITWYAVGNLIFLWRFSDRFNVSQAFLWVFRSISEKTLSAEYPGYTGDHSTVYHFQLKHVVLVKSRAKSYGVKLQESHFCQYMVMTRLIS